MCRALIPARLLAACCLLLLLGSRPAEAALQSQIVEQPYPVPLQPGQRLLPALNAATPVREQGRIFHGRTRWHVRSGYRWQKETTDKGEQCRLAEVRVLLQAQIVLPELGGAPSAEQRADFDRYLAALRVHEQGHIAIVEAAAARIDEALQSLPPAPRCEELERQARRIRDLVLEQAGREGEDYDRQTGHGCSQGACLR
ncbi:DUF922 domain-containing protein [Paucibacter sp. APW11]|uniref:DUF922 domain-containing protein n=1 Tax=Roseateles aquae TaxID=3077235 RepID=A0ABU3PDV2_9BURK|nr:DUF922 domain-containing protein [Paucibacter sp. APW11]MDT9000780.1 DUF922 domain-containing protein [Paucibacter sp. APW11]